MNLKLGLLKRFKDISIKHKLQVSIIIFIILPLVITGFYLNNRFSDITLNSYSETSLQILKQVSQNLSNTIQDTEDLSLRIISNDNVQRLASGRFNNDIEEGSIYRNISIWIDDVIGSKTYFDSITISKKNQILFQEGNLIVQEDSNYLKKSIMMQGRGFWTVARNPKYYNNDSKKVISFYRSINDFNMMGNTIGVESISIGEDQICSTYKNVNPYENGQTFLVDSTGKVLSSANKDIIGQEYGKFEYIKAALKAKEGFFFSEVGKQKSVILFSTFKENGWQLIEVIPERSFLPLETTINIVLIIAILLCILFGILFSSIQSEFIVKPLNRLLKEMKKVRKGNFDINVNIESKDEIGEITRGFTEMAQQLKKTINDVYISKINLREAELIALEAQINPHFLYNTLDSIHWLAIKNKDYNVSDQIEALSEIFKHVLSKGREIVYIRDEMEFLNNYMFLQKSKYGNRIKLVTNIDEGMMDYRVPKLVLQPLVENSILHGLEQKIEGGSIWVTIKIENNCLHCVVSDDGLGVVEEEVNKMLNAKEESHNVFALKNIDERIKLNYGEEYGLSFSSEEGKGTRVEVIMPLIK